MFDGDTIFAMATGQDPLVIDEQAEGAPRDRFGSPDTRPGNLNALLEAAAICFAEACTDALLAARQHESDPVGPPSYRGCAPSVFGPGDAHH
jgi:L-aminopeptidase/D-esterase-like protein